MLPRYTLPSNDDVRGQLMLSWQSRTISYTMLMMLHLKL
jgi:hypothetical protein